MSKGTTLDTLVNRAGSLLDLGCGRGGDLSKWREAEVQRVLGMDLSADQLEDARRRAKDGGARNTTQLEWMQGSLVDQALEEKLRDGPVMDVHCGSAADANFGNVISLCLLVFWK